MLLVFWLNWLLLATATGERAISGRWFVALAGAATLAPLWDYGFEVRHDNVILLGLLIAWNLVRFQPARWQGYLAVGGIAGILQFVAFKSIAYTGLLGVALVALPPRGEKASRAKTALWLMTGAAIAFGLIQLAFRASQHWHGYTSVADDISASSVGHVRLTPWFALGRLPLQTPLLLALVFSALSGLVFELRQRGRAALGWEGCMPEAALFMAATLAFFLNPTPYPYNLVNLVPFAFLLAYRHAAILWSSIAARPALCFGCVSIVIFTHVGPFVVATQRHWSKVNDRQEALMHLAENLTDPATDAVYDAGVALVPTRKHVNSRADLHSFTTRKHLEGTGTRICETLTEETPPVFIPTYRTDWLFENVMDFIRGRYVALSDDIWVLGKVLPAGGGTVDIVRTGRYRIAPLAASNLAGTYRADLRGFLESSSEAAPDSHVAGTLDGGPVPEGAVELTAGAHVVKCGAEVQVAVFWVGPELDRLPRMGAGNHRELFDNWY
jgi:hypothetical protein